MQIGNRGRPQGLDLSKKAITTPNREDIIRTAAFFDGEGNVHVTLSLITPEEITCSSLQASISQKDFEPIQWLIDHFGGNFTRIENDTGGCYSWFVSGSRAYGFLLTIYQFLWTRRRCEIEDAICQHKGDTDIQLVDKYIGRDYVDKIFDGDVEYEEYYQVIDDCRIREVERRQIWERSIVPSNKIHKLVMKKAVRRAMRDAGIFKKDDV